MHVSANTREARNASLARDQQRLSMLKAQMALEKEAWEKKRTAGGKGCRWRSARPDKGGIRSYDKDVRRSKRGGGSGSERSSGGRAARPSDPSKWSVNHVCKWLRKELQFDKQSRAVFREQEIDGAALLELTEGDFVALGVTKIGRRKALARAIAGLMGVPPAASSPIVTRVREQMASEALSAGSSAATASMSTATATAGATTTASMGTESDPAMFSRVGSEIAAQKPPPRKIHWTQGKQRTGTLAVPGEAAEMPVNLADGAFDEQASHASFLAALHEWRSAGASDAARGAEGGSAASAGTATAVASVSVSASISTDSISTAASGGGGGGGAMWVNPFAQPAAGAPRAPSPELLAARPGSLLDGELDEIREHALFQAAVEEWRSGGASAASAEGSSGSGAGGTGGVSAATSAAARARGGAASKKGRGKKGKSGGVGTDDAARRGAAQQGMLDELRAWIDDGYEAFDDSVGSSPCARLSPSLEALQMAAAAASENSARGHNSGGSERGGAAASAAAIVEPLIDPWTVELSF